ncbi:MAG: spore cortex biosynthesis protein YabQ [Butyribacter sp.]|nr:spore cortex biosynthesis protein YabQ [bacterium]MDY3853884.1 spore cortex biosynthesis protein YabQ [Butyribacter sp.]
MTEIILGQVRFVVVTAFWGMILMLGYDVLRFGRWLVHHNKIAIAIEDILYWCVMSVPTYVVFFIYNEGEIRWYGVLAVLVGGAVYEKGISRLVRRLGYHYLTKPKNRLKKWISKCLKKLLTKGKKIVRARKNSKKNIAKL